MFALGQFGEVNSECRLWWLSAGAGAEICGARRPGLLWRLLPRGTVPAGGDGRRGSQREWAGDRLEDCHQQLGKQNLKRVRVGYSGLAIFVGRTGVRNIVQCSCGTKH